MRLYSAASHFLSLTIIGYLNVVLVFIHSLLLDLLESHFNCSHPRWLDSLNCGLSKLVAHVSKRDTYDWTD